MKLGPRLVLPTDVDGQLMSLAWAPTVTTNPDSSSVIDTEAVGLVVRSMDERQTGMGMGLPKSPPGVTTNEKASGTPAGHVADLDCSTILHGLAIRALRKISFDDSNRPNLLCR